MEAVAVIVALMFAVFVALGVIAVVRSVRAVKRGVDRTVTQARRTVEDTRLKAKQYVQPGAPGEVAELRLSLRTSMRATQEALRAAAPDDPSLSEALALFKRLSTHGQEIDADLKRLEAEPDKARVAGSLPELRERVERVTHSADSLRWAAQDRARQFADDDLAMLSEQIRMEAGALRHWTTEEEPQAAPTGAGAGVRTPGTGAGTGSAGAGAEGVTAPEAEPERPAITARDAWRQPGYSWQKTRRPESTT
ncbi:hypothetical protein ACFY41_25820 [Streptomyces syringium]|uniref:hypothetical protein n=1 Tax=Streptomyces syringium TaxID=76729 RepID=UPI003681703D